MSSFRVLSVTTLFSAVSFIRDTTTHPSADKRLPPSLTREDFFLACARAYFASQNGKNLRSCAHPYALRFVLCYPPICHPERSRSFGEAVPRQNQEPRARRDLLRPTEGYINAKNIFKSQWLCRSRHFVSPSFRQVRLQKHHTVVFSSLRMTRWGGRRMFSVTPFFPPTDK